MMTLTDIILNVVNAALMVYTFNLFFSSFANKRMNTAPHVLCAVAVAVIFTLSLCFIYNKVLNLAVMLVLTFIISQLFEFKWYSGILLSFLGYVLGALSEFIASITLSILFSVDIKSTIEDSFYIVGFLLSKFIFFLIISLIRIKKKNLNFFGSPKRLLVIILIPSSTLAVLLLQYYYFVIIPNADTVASLPMLLCYVFLISANVIVFDLLEHLYQDTEKENQLEFAKKLIHSQADQYEQLLEYNKSILKMRHDHKNFLLGLISEIKNNNIDNALASLNEQCEVLKLPYNETSPYGIVGTVINAKNTLADSKGIEIDFSHSELQRIQIPEIDRAIILGNALDNAIEAVEQIDDPKQKIVSLLIRVHNNQIVIVVKNKVRENVDTEKLKTAKKNPEQHGFGILSIKELVKKYNGEVSFSCADKIFRVYITMSNKSVGGE